MDDEATPPPTPPSAQRDASKLLRKSNRIEPTKRRLYKAMQNGTGYTRRPRKKFKYSHKEISDLSCVRTDDTVNVANGPTKGAMTNSNSNADAGYNEATTTDVITNVTVAALALAGSSSSANSMPPAVAITETTGGSINNLAMTRSSMGGLHECVSQGTLPRPTTNTMANIANEHTNIAAITETVGETTSKESGVGAYTETLTETATTKGQSHINRLVPDECGGSYEDAIEALETENTDRIPDSSVPGTYDALTNTDPVVFAKIITSIGMNCVEENFATLSSALEIEKERLEKHQQNRLRQIEQDQKLMKMIYMERTEREEKDLEEKQRLSKDTEISISRLNMRELANRNLNDIMSVPTELMGEFREEDDFKNIMMDMDEADANRAKSRSRGLVKETYYWRVIQQRAKMMGPLPESSGKKTGITPQEKYTAKLILHKLGYGTNRDSVLKGRSYLKLLSDLREAGVTLFLLYRGGKFKAHFRRHPNELAMLLSWNQLYYPHLYQLRLRAIAQAGGDFSNRCDLEDVTIFDRLHLPQNVVWRDDLSDWGENSTEKNNYLANQSIKAVSGKSNTHVLRCGIKGSVDSNKSIYISMVLYNGISGKRTLSGKPASTRLLAVSPLVSVSPGDFLGTLSGRLRYTNQKPARSIQGPVQGLWLDYSEVMGKLNRIKVAKASEQTNVCLVWEGVNEVKGEKSFCQYWRVLVIATRCIKPFDQLIRPA